MNVSPIEKYEYYYLGLTIILLGHNNGWRYLYRSVVSLTYIANGKLLSSFRFFFISSTINRLI